MTDSGPYPSIRRLTVSEAILMVDVGIVRKDERVELLEGLLVETRPQGPLHSSATTGLGDRLRVVYAGCAMIREEKPLDSGRYSLPEPNVAVVRGQAGTYATRHPRGEDASHRSSTRRTPFRFPNSRSSGPFGTCCPSPVEGAIEGGRD